MSLARALREIERFLSSGEPEVLSVSGRWGVGKTYAWTQALKAMRSKTPLRRYAYVSVFGLRSLDDLKTAIVQSTISLDGDQFEPTVESFVEHLSSFAGAKRLGEQGLRRGLTLFGKGAAALPYVGKIADLLAPGAALLIRNQIVCIDDIERAGKGLEVADILGLVSTLRERRACKIVLLLNEDGLGKQGDRFREYLEKVVDQAVRFEPTPIESAGAAIDAGDAIGQRLAECTVRLGITNIRVIRRLRRFLSFVEPLLVDLHDGVTNQVVHSLALLGWCVFEPGLSPPLSVVEGYNRYRGLFGDADVGEDEANVDRMLASYAFASFDEVDHLILAGLKAGAFDDAAMLSALKGLDLKLAKDDVRSAIVRPWTILGQGFGPDLDEIVATAVASIEDHGGEMSPAEATDALNLLRGLGRADEAERLLTVYLAAQEGRSRDFFAARHGGRRNAIDPDILAAFDERLSAMPPDRDPKAILLSIGSTNGWNPADVAFLATVPVEDYVTMLRGIGGTDLATVIDVALRFGMLNPADDNDREVAARMRQALMTLAGESDLNRMRVRGYLPGLDGDAAPDSHQG